MISFLRFAVRHVVPTVAEHNASRHYLAAASTVHSTSDCLAERRTILYREGNQLGTQKTHIKDLGRNFEYTNVMGKKYEPAEFQFPDFGACAQ